MPFWWKKYSDRENWGNTIFYDENSYNFVYFRNINHHFYMQPYTLLRIFLVRDFPAILIANLC